MEYENLERGTRMTNRCLNLDIISTLPENIIENILSLMPIRDALRTSILSKKWRYSWRSMPKLEFTNDIVKPPSGYISSELKKYKIINTIFHVLLFHNGPSILEFNLSVDQLHMDSEVAQIISYLARDNTVKELNFVLTDRICYKLPVSLFSLQGLQHLHLEHCTFELPLTFNGFSRLKSMNFCCVEVSPQVLQRFFSKCPILEQIRLGGYRKHLAEKDKFTFIDILQCVPLIRSLDIVSYLMEYSSAGGIPHKLPASLVHLGYLSLSVCVTELNEISFALCMIRSSPLLVKINFIMYDKETLPVQQTPSNFLDLEHYSDLKLDHLETLEIEMFSYLPLVMDFMKVIMAKSPVLKKVSIELSMHFSVDEEVEMLKDLVRLPLQRASCSAEIIIKRS